jgi:hypothetical protein
MLKDLRKSLTRVSLYILCGFIFAMCFENQSRLRTTNNGSKIGMNDAQYKNIYSLEIADNTISFSILQTARKRWCTYPKQTFTRSREH